MTPWLAVVGIGEDGLDGLGRDARAAVDAATVLIGGSRHLAMLPTDGREHWQWPSPFDALIAELQARRGAQVCVLASGDPLWFGVASRLREHFAPDEMQVWPAPSAFSLACARLHWSVEATTTISLHGRPLAGLHKVIAPGARIVALSSDERTPSAVAQALVARGFAASMITVLECIGGTRERIRSAPAGDFNLTDIAALNVIAIECVASARAPVYSSAPGLPDEAYVHDGQLTKRVVRSATVAALAPLPGQLLWDVGAGCGSISIEWMRAASDAHAIAIERDPARVQMIATNAQALGVPALEIVSGSVPDALADLALPDAIFIGGALADPVVFEFCWRQLKPGGRLVMNAVTLQGEAQLHARYVELDGELTRIAVAVARAVGRFDALAPSMSVTQLSLRKPNG